MADTKTDETVADPATDEDTETDFSDDAELAAKAEAKRSEDAASAPVDVKPDDKNQFEGQFYGSEHWSVETVLEQGNPSVHLHPRNWVGDGLRIAPAEVGEVTGLLGKVKNLG